jgi:acyl dehydratase
MNETEQPKIEFEKLTAGYEFAPVSLELDSEKVREYLNAVADRSTIYQETNIVPPMAISALAMAAMSSGLVLPPGAIHVSQNLEFLASVRTGEKLISRAKVNRKIERGKFHMLNIGIKILNHRQDTVLTGETAFILPLVAEEK